MCGGTSVPVRYRGGKSWPSSLVLGALGFTTARTVRPAPTPSPPLGAERVGVRWGIPERAPTPTSPSQRYALGPSLSPLKGGEGKSPRKVKARVLSVSPWFIVIFYRSMRCELRRV